MIRRLWTGGACPAVWASLLLLVPFSHAAAAAPVTRTLDNGMKVAVLTDPRLPVVQIQLMVPAGSVREGPREHGAARLVAALLLRGTASRSTAEFSAEVERLGGTLAANAALEFAVVSGVFRTSDLEAGIELLADAARNPLFSDLEVSGLRSELMRAIVQSRRTPAVLADEHAWALALPSHPYGVPDLGTLESVAGLSLDQLQAFHRACYRPDHALLVIAGNVEVETAFQIARDRFGDWKGTSRWAALPAPEPRSGPALRIIDVPGAPDAEVRLAFAGPGRVSPDALALVVANDILGGGPGSRLGGSGARGLRAYSHLDLRRVGGVWTLGGSVSADSVGALAGRMRDELRRFVSDPPGDPEVSTATRALGRSFSLAHESLASQAAEWLSAAFHGLDDGIVDGYPARLAAVTAAEVRAAAARWMNPDRAAIVVVGAADRIRPQLEPLGTVEVVAADAPAIPLAPVPSMDLSPPTPEALSRGRELASLAVRAHGGAARLQDIKDSTAEADIVLYAEERTAAGKQRELRREPQQLRLEVDLGEMSSIQALDGDRAWVRVSVPADSVMDGDSLVVDGLKAVFHSDVIHLLRATQLPGTRLAWRGEDPIADRPANVVEVVTADGRRTVLYFDRERHHLVAAEDNQGSPLAGPVLRRLFSEPRTVQGIVLPQSEERLINGKRTLTLKTTRFVFNSGLDALAFEKPGKSGPRPRRR